jgi:uncharacterized membrane protein
MDRFQLTFQRDVRSDLMLIAIGAVVVALAARLIGVALRERQLRGWPLALAAGAVAALTLATGAVMIVAMGPRTGLLACAGLGVNVLLLGAWVVLLVWRRYDVPSVLSIILATVVMAGVDAAAFVDRLRQPALMLPVAVVLCIATVLVFYHSVFRYLGTGRVTLLVALRSLAILVLLALLFRPVLAVIPLGGRNPLLIMLIDASKSMSIQDARNAPSRYEDVIQTCQSEMPRVEKRFDVRYFVFDSTLRAADGLDDLITRQPEGDATNLVLAIQEALARHPNQDLFALCLLTDGNHNGPGDPIASARTLGPPLYTIGVGTEEMRSDKLQDISIAAVDAPEETVANNVCRIRAHIAAEGLANRTVEVLLKDGPQQLDRQTLVLSDRQKVQIVDLSFKPTTVGRKKLTLSVPVDPAELISQNNTHDVHLLVTDPQIKVLYIEGTVRPEYKFLRQYLSTDPSLELATLIQVRPPLFTAGGTVAGKPLKGFPTTADEFKAFDVFIIGDLDRSFLSKAQMDLLAETVRSGKALLMIGGTATLGPGGYAGTPIEQMLPISVGPRSKDRQDTTEFVPRLTAEGRAHPVFAGLEEFFSGASTTGPASATSPASGTVPPLQGCVVVEGAKPGAAVLAEHPSRQQAGRPLIVLAAQTYGTGRTAVFTADTTWRWYMVRRAMGLQSPYHRFWGQLVRWLANSELKEKSSEAGVQVQVTKSFYHPGEKVDIVAKVRDQDGQAFNFAGATATILQPDGKTRELMLPRQEDRAGVYRATFEPTLPGEHRIEVTARKQNTLLGKDSIDFTLGRPNAELEKLSLDSDRLTKMAAAGNGEYVRLPGLNDLMARLIRRYETLPHGPRQPSEYTLFTAKTVMARYLKMVTTFGLFVLLVTGEWLLRRRWQLS